MPSPLKRARIALMIERARVEGREMTVEEARAIIAADRRSAMRKRLDHLEATGQRKGRKPLSFYYPDLRPGPESE